METSPFLEEQRLRAWVQATREHLLIVLHAQLGQEVPPDIVHAIQVQGEVDTLERWFRQTLTVTELDEVRRMLGLPAN